jgi:hypothetical protein
VVYQKERQSEPWAFGVATEWPSNGNEKGQKEGSFAVTAVGEVQIRRRMDVDGCGGCASESGCGMWDVDFFGLVWFGLVEGKSVQLKVKACKTRQTQV